MITFLNHHKDKRRHYHRFGSTMHCPTDLSQWVYFSLIRVLYTKRLKNRLPSVLYERQRIAELEVYNFMTTPKFDKAVANPATNVT